jgi:hypothetical protein
VMRGIATLAGLCTVETLTSRILVFFHVFKSLERLPKLATSYMPQLIVSATALAIVVLILAMQDGSQEPSREGCICTGGTLFLVIY